MIADRPPIDAPNLTQLANPLSVLIHPLRFLAAEDGDLVPTFGQAEKIRQHLGLPEGIGQPVISNVEDLAFFAGRFLQVGGLAAECA